MSATTEARAPQKTSTPWTRWGGARRATLPPPRASSNFVTAKVSFCRGKRGTWCICHLDAERVTSDTDPLESEQFQRNTTLFEARSITLPKAGGHCDTRAKFVAVLTSLPRSFSSKYIAVIINPLLNYVEVFWRSVILPSSLPLSPRRLLMKFLSSSALRKEGQGNEFPTSDSISLSLG